jgi:hypothetical protein
LPESLRETGYAAFADCKALQSVRLPKGLQKIEGRTFSQCISLENVSIPSDVTELGNEASVTNGFFRIEDDKGNAIFEITKGTASYTPATAGAITITNIMGIAHMYIPYKVKCPEPPKIFACTDLMKNDWKREDDEGFLFNVNWTGESGNWLVEVWTKNPSDTGFVKAEYKVGAEDIIRHNAPISVGKLKVEGDDKIYKVKIVTINGIKVLGVDE